MVIEEYRQVPVNWWDPGTSRSNPKLVMLTKTLHAIAQDIRLSYHEMAISNILIFDIFCRPFLLTSSYIYTHVPSIILEFFNIIQAI